MSSLLTAAEKSQIQSVFDDIHDTFSRTITIFREDNSVEIGTDSDYSGFYGRRKNSNKTHPSFQSYTTQARIKYFGETEKDYQGGGNADINVPVPYGTIRLKINETAYNLIKNAQKIEVDGQLYQLDSGAAKTGPFSNGYFVVYLKRED